MVWSLYFPFRKDLFFGDMLVLVRNHGENLNSHLPPRRERIGWMPEKRFAHVKQRGRSSTPTKSEGSWRGPEHLPVDCVIRRRRRKGPKETWAISELKDVLLFFVQYLYFLWLKVEDAEIEVAIFMRDGVLPCEWFWHGMICSAYNTSLKSKFQTGHKSRTIMSSWCEGMDATQASSRFEQMDLSCLYFAPFANLLIKTTVLTWFESTCGCRLICILLRFDWNYL